MPYSCRYSTEPYLYLGVIFYVTDVSLLEDEVTRYHYFLQVGGLDFISLFLKLFIETETESRSPNWRNNYHKKERPQTWELILYLHEVLKEQRIEIEYTSNSHITSWQSQSLRNRSPNKVEVSSWDWERPGFCIKHPGTLKKRFHQTNPPPLDGTPRYGPTLSSGAHKVDLLLG